MLIIPPQCWTRICSPACGPRPCPQSKYGQKLKSFRNVVRTSLLNKNAWGVQCVCFPQNVCFPIFPLGKKWENTHFSMGKNGVGPPPMPTVSSIKYIPYTCRECMGIQSNVFLQGLKPKINVKNILHISVFTFLFPSA